MAVHAAMVERMDREIGRVLDQLRSMGAWENTLIVFLSDNGADATLMVRGDGNDRSKPSGSAESFLCLGPGWASAANAPFRRHKIWVHEGGISTPGILHWPAAIPAGGKLRRAPAHIVDFAPTALELAGVTPPENRGGQTRPPPPGRSLVPLFKRDAALPRDALYWHHEGNRALRVGDWKIVSEAENESRWELYNLKRDRIESKNLAVSQPDRVNRMSALWQQMDEQFHREGGAEKSGKKE
jgi:arylsulfatase